MVVQTLPVQLPSSTLTEKLSVFRQLRDFRLEIPKALLTRWEEPTGVYTTLYIAQDWGIILAGHQLYMQYPSLSTFVVAIILMAWGQRGLSNLAHDSIHRNLTASKTLNDLLANMFLAPPLMSTAHLQRQDHTSHHHYLGTKDDPDHGLHNATSLKHYRHGCFDHTSIFSLFLYDALDPVMFFQNAVGSVSAAPVQLVVWWMVAATVTGLLEAHTTTLFGVSVGWNFLLLFHTTRCTLSYLGYILREIIDHSGLPSASVLSFTRTSPCCNAVQRYLQPHDDNYHLLHHLMPRIPMSNLHEAHEWLVQHVEVYANANRHTTYFSGENSLFGQSIHRHTRSTDVSKN